MIKGRRQVEVVLISGQRLTAGFAELAGALRFIDLVEAGFIGGFINNKSVLSHALMLDVITSSGVSQIKHGVIRADRIDAAVLVALEGDQE